MGYVIAVGIIAFAGIIFHYSVNRKNGQKGSLIGNIIAAIFLAIIVVALFKGCQISSNVPKPFDEKSSPSSE